jgi:hypothetical protein
MRDRDGRRPSFAGHAWTLLLAPIILTATFFAPAFAQNSEGPGALATSPSEIGQALSTKALEDWRATMRRARLPKKGCFTSAYPSTQWQELPCTTAPKGPIFQSTGCERPRWATVTTSRRQGPATYPMRWALSTASPG